MSLLFRSITRHLKSLKLTTSFFLLMLFLFTFQSCTLMRLPSLSKLEKPEIIYKGYDYKGIHSGDIDLDISLDFYNPNDVAIDELEVKYQFYTSNDELILDSDYIPIHLPANKTSSYVWPAKISIPGILRSGAIAYTYMLAGLDEMEGFILVKISSTKPSLLRIAGLKDSYGESFPVKIPLPELNQKTFDKFLEKAIKF